MILSPNIFDSILATGDSRKPASAPSKADVFGVRSLNLPTPVAYESLDDAVASLRKAVQGTKP
jgi:hypothetical protein